MVYTNGKKILKASGCQAVYASAEVLLRYIAGFEAESGCLITDKTGTTLYTDKRYIEAAEKLFQGTDVTPTLYKQSDVQARLAAYEKVGISYDWTSHVEYLAMEKAGVKTENADKAFAEVMSVKSAWELGNIERACSIAEEAFLELLPQIKEGMTETEIAALLEYNMRKRGAEGTSFSTIVAFGAHAAVPHHVTGADKLKFGDEILIDFGCKVNGYCSDITRTFLFGDNHKNAEFKKAYAAVLAAHELVKETAKSGRLARNWRVISPSTPKVSFSSFRLSTYCLASMVFSLMFTSFSVMFSTMMDTSILPLESFSLMVFLILSSAKP